MQLDLEESSPNHPDQEQRAEIALGYGTIFEVDRHWVQTKKKLSSLDPKENHRSDSPIDYLEKMKPSLSYPYLPLKMIESRRRKNLRGRDKNST